MGRTWVHLPPRIRGGGASPHYQSCGGDVLLAYRASPSHRGASRWLQEFRLAAVPPAGWRPAKEVLRAREEHVNVRLMCVPQAGSYPPVGGFLRPNRFMRSTELDFAEAARRPTARPCAPARRANSVPVPSFSFFDSRWRGPQTQRPPARPRPGHRPAGPRHLHSRTVPQRLLLYAILSRTHGTGNPSFEGWSRTRSMCGRL
jgi:hypothetical protein